MSEISQAQRVAIMFQLLGKEGLTVLESLARAGHPEDFLDKRLQRYIRTNEWTTEPPSRLGYYKNRSGPEDDGPLRVRVMDLKG